MILARRHGLPLLEARGLEPSPALEASLLMGSIAPDAGFHPGADRRLARYAHCEEPWTLCRAMSDLAESPAEKAFALGWLSHVAADQRGHRDLVCPLTDNDLDHERLEWGLDCHLLQESRHEWLWQAPMQSRPGTSLWSRALLEVRQWPAAEPLTLKALAIEKRNMLLIRWLELFMGHTAPALHAGCGRLSRLVGRPLQYGLVGLCRLANLGRQVEAVLTPSVPVHAALEQWEALQQAHGRDLLAALEAGSGQASERLCGCMPL